MLSTRRPSSNESLTKCTPHLLPCRIHHDGPVNASERHWAPHTSQNGIPESYFRGRKLRGRAVRIPERYRGVVIKEGTNESSNPRTELKNAERMRKREEGEDEDEDEDEEVKIMEEVGDFEELMVWGHENIVGQDDALVKGIEEWIGFAEAMHQPGLEDGNKEEKR